MAGTIVINILLGMFGFIIVFLLSFSTNSMTTTFERSAITFVLFFLSAYLFRWTHISRPLDKNREDFFIFMSNESLKHKESKGVSTS